jgi:hypothetical protein
MFRKCSNCSPMVCLICNEGPPIEFLKGKRGGRPDKLYTMMLYRVHLTWVGFELTTLVVIWTDCIGSHPLYLTYIFVRNSNLNPLYLTYIFVRNSNPNPLYLTYIFVRNSNPNLLYLTYIFVRNSNPNPLYLTYIFVRNSNLNPLYLTKGLRLEFLTNI